MVGLDALVEPQEKIAFQLDLWYISILIKQFREGGMGEIYLYLDDGAQVPQICKIPPFSECNPVYGSSIGRGAFSFASGAWTSISQTITLNTMGKPDGKLSVSHNGKEVIAFNQVVWQSTTKVPFVGIQFETFFGGSNPSWATPKLQYSYYKDFSLSYN